MGTKSARSTDGSCLGHAPEVLDLQIEAIEPADHFERRRGASTDHADWIVEFPTVGILLECVEHGDPNRGYTASDGNVLTDQQAKNAFWIDIRTGENQARAQHRSEEHTSELQSHSDLVCRLLL